MNGGERVASGIAMIINTSLCYTWGGNRDGNSDVSIKPSYTEMKHNTE